jgi:hypothetical protein
MKQHEKYSQSSLYFGDLLWDFWCLVSVVGIWPRFIEPRLIATTKLSIKIPSLPKNLNGLKILQLSDLHFHPGIPDYFLKKMISKIRRLAPDLIVFTGDFLCCSKLVDQDRLQQTLAAMQAPFGCFAILGNHDYSEYVSINQNGDYDVSEDKKSSSITKGLKRLLNKEVSVTKKVTARAQNAALHQPLVDLLKKTPFELLHNRTTLVPIKGSHLNICGLGEHMLGRFLPEEAFQGYDHSFPGVVLTHNPDSVPHLKGFPGDLVLSGHTHGGQVNIPGMSKKFTVLENMHLKRGLKKIDGKWVYINRGIGSSMTFRCFSVPEITLLTLSSQDT